ncbi:hypothetical protein, partial [Streptomyces sp. NPDC002619]|uniref:hypothetical protein n=1 Tax=Streptomyces sp. NPDC002619 TaxID=3364655 RepID=UPI0036AA10F3
MAIRVLRVMARKSSPVSNGCARASSSSAMAGSGRAVPHDEPAALGGVGRVDGDVGRAGPHDPEER